MNVDLERNAYIHLFAHKVRYKNYHCDIVDVQLEVQDVDEAYLRVVVGGIGGNNVVMEQVVDDTEIVGVDVVERKTEVWVVGRFSGQVCTSCNLLCLQMQFFPNLQKVVFHLYFLHDLPC